MGDVWGDFARVGAALGAEVQAAAVVADLKARIAAVSARVAGRARPRVAAIEWLDPLMVAGNWVPELVEAAGGTNLLAIAGQHSPWLEWDQLIAADPDVIVLMPCGFRIPQTLAELPVLAADPRWRGLRAVRDGQVFATDGQYFFNRPGPRLVESTEILAEIFHPGVVFGRDGGSGEGEGWLRVGRDGSA